MGKLSQPTVYIRGSWCLPVNVNNVMWMFYFHSMETLRYIGLYILVIWIVLRCCWLTEKHLCHCTIKWVVLLMLSGYTCICVTYMCVCVILSLSLSVCVCVCVCMHVCASQPTYASMEFRYCLMFATCRSHVHSTAEVLQCCVSGYRKLRSITTHWIRQPHKYNNQFPQLHSCSI